MDEGRNKFTNEQTNKWTNKHFFPYLAENIARFLIKYMYEITIFKETSVL